MNEHAANADGVGLLHDALGGVLEHRAAEATAVWC